MSHAEMFHKVVSEIDAVVAYEPFAAEVDYRTCPLIANLLRACVLLPQDKDEHPLEWAAKVTKQLEGKHVCVLIPGRRFDRAGTRHGRGYGWYDRFLYSVPRAWVRIGVTDDEHIYEEPLPRQAWDEPVDWVLILAKHKWNVVQTNARR